jgi:L-arabinonolactonase
MSQSLEPTLIVDCKNLLGEAVVWNTRDERVYWTDVYAQSLYSCDVDGGDVRVVPLPDKLGSFAFDPDGNLLAAFSKGLYRYELATGRRERLTSFEPELERTRLNDGRCDRAGRFVVGGCHQGFQNHVSSVISYSPGGDVRTLIQGVALTNGIAFSVDGRRMYFSDSETLVYHYYDYDVATGELGARHELTRIPEGSGFADGSAVDADDNVWNARYYGGVVQQYRPDGALGLTVQLPTDCPSCVCFGGKHLDMLFITTARKDLSPAKLEGQPGAGGLYRVALEQVGLPEARFAEQLFGAQSAEWPCALPDPV